MRADLMAATSMKENNLWFNLGKRIIGELPGVLVGDVFFNRMEMCVIGLHRQVQAGIDYAPSSQNSFGEPIATSIIIAGGYEDNEDAGDVIIYSGHGGKDKNNRQIKDQSLERGNLALERTMHHGVPVRVIRHLWYGSCKIYVYDGLYRITDTLLDAGKSGFRLYKFRLIRIENQVQMGSAILRYAENLRSQPSDFLPTGYVTLDLSKKKEKFPVLFFNDVDENNDPIYSQYLTTTVFPPHVYNCGNYGGCDCVGGCADSCICATNNGGRFAYDINGNLVRGKPIIFECGRHCRCPPTCRNRVTQNGIKYRFEVFRSKDAGWGVRSLDLIPAGSFICEFAGVVLTPKQAKIFTMNGDNLIYSRHFTARWREWGNLSQVFADFVCPASPSVPQPDFAMDVSFLRNIAYYMGRRSHPNVMVQSVLYDHNNVSFPHLMLFATENIPPMREISLDYRAADE